MKERSLRALMPENTPDYMFPAWVGCIKFAIGESRFVEAFRKDTGCTYRPPQTPIEKAIDEATGSDWEFLKQFVHWANENVWGDPFEEAEEFSDNK